MHLRAIGITLLSMLVCVGLVVGWQTLYRLMFSENPAYEIRTLDITTEHCVTPQRLKELTGIREGVNLHSFSASKKRRELLRNLPNLYDARIVKRFPDHVEIRATDRVPVMKLGATNFAVDKDGNVLAMEAFQRRRWANIPVLIEGNRKIQMQPGQVVSDKYRTALDIVNIYNAMEGISFKINQIDISGRIYILLITSDGHREIRLVWSEMTSSENMRLALKMASATLADPKAAPLIRFDVVLETKFVYGI
ncbi:MAG: cell division protein FtsQ/DivIB [Kiritimatiellia bacterium]|jgi:hypothetical protein